MSNILDKLLDIYLTGKYTLSLLNINYLLFNV